MEQAMMELEALFAPPEVFGVTVNSEESNPVSLELPDIPPVSPDVLSVGTANPAENNATVLISTMLAFPPSHTMENNAMDQIQVLAVPVRAKSEPVIALQVNGEVEHFDCAIMSKLQVHFHGVHLKSAVSVFALFFDANKHGGIVEITQPVAEVLSTSDVDWGPFLGITSSTTHFVTKKFALDISDFVSAQDNFLSLSNCDVLKMVISTTRHDDIKIDNDFSSQNPFRQVKNSAGPNSENVSLQHYTGGTMDISVLITYQSWQQVYYNKVNSGFTSESMNGMGYILHINEVCGHALTHKILILCSLDCPYAADDSNLRAELSGGEDALDSTPIIKSASDEVSSQLNMTLPNGEPNTLPVIHPEDLVGHTFLMDMDDKGQVLHACMIKMIQDHENDMAENPNCLKFVLSVNNDQAKEIIMYNQLLNHIY
jgi:hypothetical protein